MQDVDNSPGGAKAPTLTRDDWNRRYAGKELVWSAEPNKLLVAEVETLRCARALDLGAGEGRNAIWLAKRGWQVRAVDLSDVAIEKARQLADRHEVSGRIDFEAADLQNPDAIGGQFELVILMYLHLPWEELLPVLQRATQAVAPGGTLVLIGHDLSNLEEGFGGPQDPELLYTAERVARALETDLVIGKARRVERKVKSADEERFAFDCLVRATRP